MEVRLTFTKIQTLTPRKKANKKSFSNSARDTLYNDTTLDSVQRIWRSAKIDWTKKISWARSSSHTKVGRNNWRT